MSTEQFKKRTTALKIPKDIYNSYDKICKTCGACQKSKIAPPRSRSSGLRAEIFGDLTFLDHGEIQVQGGGKLLVLIILDGATNLVTGYAVRSLDEEESIEYVKGYLDTYQLTPRSVVADGA